MQDVSDLPDYCLILDWAVESAFESPSWDIFTKHLYIFYVKTFTFYPRLMQYLINNVVKPENTLDSIVNKIYFLFQLNFLVILCMRIVFTILTLTCFPISPLKSTSLPVRIMTFSSNISIYHSIGICNI